MSQNTKKKITFKKYNKWTPFKENVFGEAPQKETFFKLSSSGNDIIFEFKVFDDYIKSFGEKNHDLFYHGDIVEIILTKENKNQYLEIELNPEGLYYIAIVNNTEQGLEICQIDIDMETCVNIKEYGWDAKVRIELDLLKNLAISSEPFFAVYRQDFTSDKLNLYALNPTYAKTFHKIESFEKLPIDDKLF